MLLEPVSHLPAPSIPSPTKNPSHIWIIPNPPLLQPITGALFRGPQLLLSRVSFFYPYFLLFVRTCHWQQVDNKTEKWVHFLERHAQVLRPNVPAQGAFFGKTCPGLEDRCAFQSVNFLISWLVGGLWGVRGALGAEGSVKKIGVKWFQGILSAINSYIRDNIESCFIGGKLKNQSTTNLFNAH